MTYQEAITAYGREFSVRARFEGADTVTFNTGVASFSISEVFSQSESELTMGSAFSTKMEITLYPQGVVHDYRNNKVALSVLLTDPDGGLPFSVSFGTSYRVSEVSTSSDYNQVSIVAYDAMGELFNKEYKPSPGITSFADIVNEICTENNIPFSGTVINHPITAGEIYQGTQAQMLAYIAGCMGTNAVINRSGELEFRWYTDRAYVIDPTATVENGFMQKAEQDFVVNSVTAGTGDNPPTAGTGKGIIFENPYITQTEVQAIYDNVKQFTYLPCQVSWFGDPYRTIGDIVVVYDRFGEAHNAIISQQSIQFSGGYRSEIISAGSDETSVAFDNMSPTDRKLADIRENYTTLQQSFVNSMNVILGASGVFELVDDDHDNVNEGWRIWNSDRTRYIMATSGGIGFFDLNNVPCEAITFDGITADAITTGTMSAERISVGNYNLSNYFQVFADPNNNNVITVQIGNGANGMVLQQTGDRIAFMDQEGNLIAYWDSDDGIFSMPLLTRFVIGGCEFIEQDTGNLILKGAS